jgi:hypothetical protein
MEENQEEVTEQPAGVEVNAPELERKQISPHALTALLIVMTIILALIIGWGVILMFPTTVCYNTTIVVDRTEDLHIVSMYPYGLIDHDGNGYVYDTSAGNFSPGKTYNITYCVYQNNGRRQILSPKPEPIIKRLPHDPYLCVLNNDGVCK